MTDFVANEQETFRLTMDTVVEERPLRELYLRPFEIAIREANPWAVMSSYNLVNGIHADMNEHTLKDILRKEWQYDGWVAEDVMAVYLLTCTGWSCLTGAASIPSLSQSKLDVTLKCRIRTGGAAILLFRQ